MQLEAGLKRSGHCFNLPLHSLESKVDHVGPDSDGICMMVIAE